MQIEDKWDPNRFFFFVTGVSAIGRRVCPCCMGWVKRAGQTSQVILGNLTSFNAAEDFPDATPVLLVVCSGSGSCPFLCTSVIRELSILL